MILTTMMNLTLLAQATTLPGSNLTVAQANEKATVIVVAEYSRLELISSSGPHSFGTIGMKDSEILKGELNAGELDRVSFSASGREVNPTLGKEYMVFFEKNKAHYMIVKMLPKTPENIEAVKKEIKAGKQP